MATLGERIRELRNEKGWTAKQLANRVGVAESTILNYERGGRNPKRSIMDDLCDIFNVKEDYLKGKTDVRSDYGFDGIYKAGYDAAIKQTIKCLVAPLYSCISCGTGTWVDEQPEDYVGVPAYMTNGSSQYFANPADGDSMEPLIKSTDCLIFEKTDEIPSGKIGSFSLNGQYYCKRFKRFNDGSIWLFSENSSYAPIPVKPEDEFRVLGLYKYKLSKEQ